MPIDPSDLPSTPRAEYLAAAPDVQMIRDILGGTRQIRAANFTKANGLYIDKYKAEKPELYKKRATSAKLYGGLNRSLSASIGMLFAKPPQQNGTWTDEIKAHWESIDGKGTHGNVFAKRRAEDGIADGFVGILVDFPVIPDGVTVTAETDKALNLRPKWNTYRRADILSWVTSTIDNVDVPIQIVLREGASERVGKFGIKPKVLYRVCQLGVVTLKDGTILPRAASWTLLEEVKGQNGEIAVVERGSGVFIDGKGVPFDTIPLAVGYTGRTEAHFCAQPPLLDLAWCNLEHWQIANDVRWYERICAFPQPFVEGNLMPDANGVRPAWQMGPGVLLNFEVGSKGGWLELTGKSIDALRNSLQEKKDEMGELGASFLAKKSRGIESAEAKRIDASAENATLATAGQGIEDMFNQALQFHARYMGIEAANAPTIKLNSDFESLKMDPQTLTAYVGAVADVGIPVRLLLEKMQAGGLIGEDEDLDELEAEIKANQAAIAEQKRVEALAQAQPPTTKKPPAAAAA